jgi:nicotinamidase-related amidase
MSWREDVARLPSLAPTQFAMSPDSTALVVVDMQYVDAHRDYGLGESLRRSHPEVWSYYFARVEDCVVPNVKRIVELFRSREMRIIYLTFGPILPDGGDLLPERRGDATDAVRAMFHSQGSFEAGILPELTPRDGELVINKTSRSAFNSTAIDRTLRNLGIESLVVVGVTTSSCVDTTARDAADRGFAVVVVEDATAELDEQSHDAALRQFAVRWGRVWTTDQTICELTQSAAEPGSAGVRL